MFDPVASFISFLGSLRQTELSVHWAGGGDRLGTMYVIKPAAEMGSKLVVPTQSITWGAWNA